MKTDLDCFRLVRDVLDGRKNLAFEPPATGSRTHPGALTRCPYSSTPTKLHILGNLFDDAVRIEGLEQAAAREAWKVVSGLVAMYSTDAGWIDAEKNLVFNTTV